MKLSSIAPTTENHEQLFRSLYHRWQNYSCDNHTANLPMQLNNLANQIRFLVSQHPELLQLGLCFNQYRGINL